MHEETLNYAKQKVNGPAVALMITAGISAILILVAIPIDIYLLASGVAAKLPQRGAVPRDTTIVIRIAWDILLLISNLTTFIGANQMRKLQGKGLATLACVLACIPCLGPCCIIGIPFGIWGFSVLNDPQVRWAFDLNARKNEP